MFPTMFTGRLTLLRTNNSRAEFFQPSFVRTFCPCRETVSFVFRFPENKTTSKFSSEQLPNMQLIVFRHDSEDLVAIEVPDEADSDLLYQLLAAETGKQFRDEYVEFEGQPVRPGQSLMQLGILDGSTLFIKRIEALQAPSASANPSVSPAKATMSLRDIPANIKPDELLQLCINNPHIQTQLNASDPELGAILAARDIGKLRTIMMKRYMARHKQEHDRQLEQRQMEEDPMNPEVQKKIEEQVSLCTWLRLSS